MSLATGRYQLANAYKALKQEWQDTENIWRDTVRQEFADQSWEPLLIRLNAILTAMDRFDQVMGKMMQECGEGSVHF